MRLVAVEDEARPFGQRANAATENTDAAEALDAIVGVSAAIRRVRALAARYGRTAWPTLVSGETGTGKELVATAVHCSSERRDRPLVAVNCAAVPAELLESEFFGTARGAFTGAYRQRHGLLHAADQSSLFLDEVGELPALLQAKLLRFLDQGSYRSLGATEERHADVRIIAATNRDLRRLVQDGTFRSDLYYRLDVLHIHVPPLRERPEDIPVLARALLRRFLPGHPIELGERAACELMAHPWPGNARELLRVLLRSALAGPAAIDEIVDEPWTDGDDAPPENGGSLHRSVREFERERVRAVLDRHDGNRSAAARELGLTYRGLLKKMRRHGWEAAGSAPQPATARTSRSAPPR